ncbi:MAG TPA: tetratricopeptide repeat protein [Geobacteraceae bacterium]
MKKENIVIAVLAIVIVVLGGVLIFSLSGRKETPQAEKVPAGSGSPADYQQRIAELEKMVANEPNNLQAWTMLANDYFDTDQPQKAVAAYDRAIALDPNNPNLLTDQGVMFKRLGSFDKALANFEKAQKIDPRHLQSIYNMGIIYAEDLKRRDMAIKTWDHYLELDSTSPAAQQVKKMIEQLKEKQPKPGAK